MKCAPCRKVSRASGRQVRIRLCCCFDGNEAGLPTLAEQLQAREKQYHSEHKLTGNFPFSTLDSELPILHRMQNPHQSQPDHIRLLKLQAGNPKETLRGEIITSSLVDHPQYSALSYVWGEEQSSERCASPNGDIRLGKMAADALRALRPLKDHIYVWIDAICIDQESRLDVAARVSHVGNIYRNAQFVIWWLWQCTAKPRLQAESHLSISSRQVLSPFSTVVLDPICFDALYPHVDSADAAAPFWNQFETHSCTHKITKQEFEDYRASLGDILACCEGDEYKLLGIILSTLAIAFRSLTMSETIRVLALSVETNLWAEPLDAATEYFTLQGQYYRVLKDKVEGLIRKKWSALIGIDNTGILSFRQSSMVIFIRSIQIPGINPTHSFMANVCLQELVLSAAAVRATDASSVTCDRHQGFSDFYGYSLENWSFHYRMVQNQDQVLSSRVHSLIWEDLSRLKMGNASKHESTDGPCSIHCLECLDWVIAYCERYHLDCLKEVYSQLSRSSTRQSKKFVPASAGLLEGECVLSDDFGSLEISSRCCSRSGALCDNEDSLTEFAVTDLPLQTNSPKQLEMSDDWILLE